MSSDVINVARRAARAEIAWQDGTAHIGAAVIIPLIVDDQIVAALPFALAGLAERLASVSAVTVTFSDSRMALKGWHPCVVTAAVDVVADRAGDWTWTGALDQEVRKHPPARLLIDTAIQRREHWWYVPRWIVRLRPVGAPRPLARRRGPDDGLLLLAGQKVPSAGTVAVEDWRADDVRVTPLDGGTAALQGSAGPALLFGHDFSIPDQERTSQLALRGALERHVLTVQQRDGGPDLPAPRLLRRLRAHVRLERACRRALAVYDASPSAAAT
jgi:hypothetical protein